MEYDLHNNVNAAVAVVEQAIVADATVVGEIIDTKGFDSLEFIAQVGTITTGSLAFVLEEGDDSGLSDAAAVPAAEILGDLVGFVVTDDDAVKRVGSIGKKRYQRLTLEGTGTSVINFVSAIAVQGHPKKMPVANN